MKTKEEFLDFLSLHDNLFKPFLNVRVEDVNFEDVGKTYVTGWKAQVPLWRINAGRSLSEQLRPIHFIVHVVQWEPRVKICYTEGCVEFFFDSKEGK